MFRRWGKIERCRPLSLIREFVREFKVERRRGGTDGSNRNRSMWRARVEWRDSIRRKDRRACRAKSGAQLRDFPYGSSRLRLKISRVSPIPDPFKNRLSILLARETLQERETFSRSYIPRESGRGRERGRKGEAGFQASPLEPFLRDSRAKICTK